MECCPVVCLMSFAPYAMYAPQLSTRESQCVQSTAQDDVIKRETLYSGCESVKDPLYNKHHHSQRTAGGLLLQRVTQFPVDSECEWKGSKCVAVSHEQISA